MVRHPWVTDVNDLECIACSTGKIGIISRYEDVVRVVYFRSEVSVRYAGTKYRSFAIRDFKGIGQDAGYIHMVVRNTDAETFPQDRTAVAV